mgnify:FL=1
MIEFLADDKDAVIKIETNIHLEGKHIHLNFRMPRSGRIDAFLLKKHLEQQFELRVEAIRREAYNQGWKDKASHKKTKRTWFPSWFHRSNMD